MASIDMQTLLNEEAVAPKGAHLDTIRVTIREQRGNTPPVCFGDDDCSTNILSKCPWRFDCGV